MEVLAITSFTTKLAMSSMLLNAYRIELQIIATTCVTQAHANLTRGYHTTVKHKTSS